MAIIFDSKQNLSNNPSGNPNRPTKVLRKKSAAKTPAPIKPLPKGFSPQVAKLLQTYQQFYEKHQLEVDSAPIHVDEIASKVALFYERIRKVVDWKEEHLVRRGAIERILKRKMITKISGINLIAGFNPEKIAEPLVLELIRGGHFPNDKIPQQRIADITKILEKYAFILENNPLEKNITPKIKKKINLYNWLLEIAACEIEEKLEPPIKQSALILCMVESMLERIRLSPADLLGDKEKHIQIYIATLRTLFNLDEPIITYYLLKIKFDQWNNPSDDFIRQSAQNIFIIKQDIKKSLSHPFENQFYSLCEKYDTVYLLLGDILEKFKRKPSKIAKSLKKAKNFTLLIKKSYNKRLSTLKKRLFRAAIYSTLSVFISGGLSLFIFEVPLTNLIYGEWKPLAIAVDILLPTALMAFLVAIVKPPRKSNFARVVKEAKKIVYPQKDTDTYEIKARRKRGLMLNLIISFLYLLGTLISLTLIFFVFELAQIPVTSLYIDTLNIAVIVFAALIIRQRSKELTVEEKASLWEFAIDILSVPVAEIGQWLANKWKEYNIISVFFIALIDMPFSTFIHFIENWRSFLKERKSEIH